MPTMERSARAADDLSKQIDLEQRIVNPVKKLHLIEKPLNWREFKYPFVYGQADFKLFSHSDWRDCARQALGARDFWFARW